MPWPSASPSGATFHGSMHLNADLFTTIPFSSLVLMLRHLCRDVFAVHLQWAQDSQAGQSTLSMICPITDLRATLHPFAALRPCGHVLSMRALQQVMLGFLEAFCRSHLNDHVCDPHWLSCCRPCKAEQWEGGCWLAEHLLLNMRLSL